MTVRHFIQREGEGETGKGHFSLTNLLTFRIGGCISDLLECVQEGSQHDDCVPGRKKRCNEGPDVILSEEDNNFMEILSRTYLIAPCSFPALLTNSSRLGTPTCNKQMGDQSWRIEIDENVSLKYLSLGTSYERAAQNVVPPPTSSAQGLGPHTHVGDAPYGKLVEGRDIWVRQRVVSALPSFSSSLNHIQMRMREI